MRRSGDRGIAAGDGGEFDPFGVGDRGDMLIAGDLAEADNGEAKGGPAAGPTHEEGVDTL